MSSPDDHGQQSPLVRASGVEIDFPSATGVTSAVRGVDLHIDAGEVLALVGMSEAGKSTMALSLMGLVPRPGRITAGEIWFEDQDLLAMGEGELRGLRGQDISLVVQSPRGALNPMLTAGTQIANVVRAHNDVDQDEARDRAVEMLRLVGINDPERRLDAYPHELSGGMAQRVLIAMALVNDPKLLIADEPTSGLDVTIQAQILDDFARSVRETATSALLVSQDMGIVANYCDRVMVMHGGRIVEHADVAAFFGETGHPSAEILLAAQAHGGSERTRSGLGASQAPLHETGCPFANGCPWAEAPVCTDDVPELREVTAGHHVRCARWEDIDVELRGHGVRT